MSGILQVRVCGEGAGQPGPLPGTPTGKAGAFFAIAKSFAKLAFANT